MLFRSKGHVSAAVAAIFPPSNWACLAAAQEACAETQALLQQPGALFLEQGLLYGQQVWCDRSSGRLRPLFPAPWRKPLFEQIHSLAHPGVRASRKLLSDRCVWKGMATDIIMWCRACVSCHRGKDGGTATAPIQPIPLPSQRFTHVHVDLVGPLPVSASGQRFLLTAIDRSTRWVRRCRCPTLRRQR